MTPTCTKKGARLYRYFVSMEVIRNRESGEETAPIRLAALNKLGAVSEADIIAALHEFSTLWSQLFPAEQTRIIQLLVWRITVTTSGLDVDIRREGIAGVIRKMVASCGMEAAE